MIWKIQFQIIIEFDINFEPINSRVLVSLPFTLCNNNQKKRKEPQRN